MKKFLRIQQTIVGLALLSCATAGLLGCGQKGLLYLPTEPAAQGRASLPQVLSPLPRSSQSPSSTPMTPASSPR